LTLLEVPGTQEFVFHRVTTGPRKGDPEIINVHPQPGELKEFLGTPASETLTEDYAVIGLVRGLNPGQAVLVLAGDTTMGTQAAVEYVCRKNSVEELLLRLSVSQSGQLKPFEAVLHVKVTRGVPVSTELVALRNGTS
jgi:molybdopterin-guanine dinucleotide biosynthesis protein A